MCHEYDKGFEHWFTTTYQEWLAGGRTPHYEYRSLNEILWGQSPAALCSYIARQNGGWDWKDIEPPEDRVWEFIHLLHEHWDAWKSAKVKPS